MELLKKLRAPGSAAGVLAIGAMLTLFWANPAKVPIYPVCLFYKLTGWSCPGCGSLRAMHQLLHGNVIEAMRFNLLLVVSLPLGAWFAVRLIQQRRRGDIGPIVRPMWIWLYGALWVVFAIVRELPNSPFGIGAP